VKLAIAMLLVPSLALADVPPPAPIPLGATQEPTSPIAAQPAGGYTVLPALPENPSRGRKIAGVATLAGGVALTVIGIVLLATNPPSTPYHSNIADGNVMGGMFALTGGVVGMGIGTTLILWPEQPYGELPGAPLLTF
jgi:hypothetical protein